MGRLLGLLAVAAAAIVILGVEGGSDQIRSILTSGKITDYDTYEIVQSPQYNVIINYIHNSLESCAKQVVVYGKGIGDAFDISCAQNLRQDIYKFVSRSVLMYGDPQEDSFCLFSDSPSSLVVIRDWKCVKRIYSTVERETSHTNSEFSDEACRRLCQKISNREYEQAHHSGYNDY